MESDRTIFSDVLPFSPHVGSADIPFTTLACILGCMISHDTILDKHILTVCCSAYMEIR